jgi:hypothetical protein
MLVIEDNKYFRGYLLFEKFLGVELSQVGLWRECGIFTELTRWNAYKYF